MEGAERVPSVVPDVPPSSTKWLLDVGTAELNTGPCPLLALWQVAQDCPLTDKLVSLKIFSPSCAMALMLVAVLVLVPAAVELPPPPQALRTRPPRVSTTSVRSVRPHPGRINVFKRMLTNHGTGQQAFSPCTNASNDNNSHYRY